MATVRYRMPAGYIAVFASRQSRLEAAGAVRLDDLPDQPSACGRPTASGAACSRPTSDDACYQHADPT